MARLNDPGRKIVTIEDPIEYQIDGIVQSQVRPEIGVSFASAIRAFVRQDPDVIMVGEIRDTDTARAAVQAAQTGHLLLTTLHANTAVSAIARLQDLGVESYLLASNLRGLVAQRLVRRLCNYCKGEQELSPQQIEGDPRHAMFGIKPGETVNVPKGCARCSDTGYRGRLPVFEILEISPSVSQAIDQHKSGKEIADIATAEGMKTLQDDAVRHVRNGLTSLSEIFRVTAYL